MIPLSMLTPDAAATRASIIRRLSISKLILEIIIFLLENIYQISSKYYSLLEKSNNNIKETYLYAHVLQRETFPLLRMK